ncbi:MAG: [FeFe] hydrogenase H-cluster maturation GTPase HydF [Chitinispirillales bacterium]|jgi:[FeFe] hydrogenase H-cluster maturation GTPase HydF|nr:[FeFe] hydrogenase H-cluster maturation GTPase HydF [Chitinispirillales bacterium]
MQKTPKSLRLTIGLFGKTNVGKSSFLNMITGQDVSIVSEIHGTTTDIVEKPMELLPIGPVLFLDTAGLDDNSELGEKRVIRTKNAIKRADIVVIITTAQANDTDLEIARRCANENIPLIIIFNKSDIEKPEEKTIKKFVNLGEILILSSANAVEREQNIVAFKEKIIKIVPEEFITPPPLLGDIVLPGKHTIFVVPIDIAAPKGRLILPQAQAIRDVLDANAVVSITQQNTYKQMFDSLKSKPDLVVCDSQVVDFVAKNTPEDVKLTTFSIVFARNKGDLEVFVEGGGKIEKLTSDDKILIAESCTHHPLEQDIGRVKIPKLLERNLGFAPQIDFCSGKDFPQGLQKYSLVIHCGGCMLTRREMLMRMETCRQKNVAITNYGVAISFLQGIAMRTIAPFM